MQFEVAYYNNNTEMSTTCADAFQDSLAAVLEGVIDVEVVAQTNHDYSYLPLSLQPPYESTDIMTTVFFYNSHLGGKYYSQYDYYIHTLERSIYPYSDNFTDTVHYFTTALACAPLQNVTIASFTIVTAATAISKSTSPSYSPILIAGKHIEVYVEIPTPVYTFAVLLMVLLLISTLRPRKPNRVQDIDNSGKPSEAISTAIERYLDRVFSSIPDGLYANTNLLQRVTIEMRHHHGILRLCGSHQQSSSKSRSSFTQWAMSLLQVYTQLSVSLVIVAVALNVMYMVSDDRWLSSVVVASLVTAVISSPLHGLISSFLSIVNKSSNDPLDYLNKSDDRAEIIKFMQNRITVGSYNTASTTSGLMEFATDTAFITSLSSTAVSEAVWYRNNVLSEVQRRHFDVDWCLVPCDCNVEDAVTNVMAKKLSFLQGIMTGFSNEVEHKLFLAGTQAQVVHQSLIYKPQAIVGLRLLQLFVLDLLDNSGGSIVGKIVALKFGYDDAVKQSSGMLSKFSRILLLLMLNACCVVGCVYLLSSLVYEDPVVRTQDWIVASALYFMQHAVVYETLAVFVVHVAIPSMMQQSIVAVRNILSKVLKQVVQGCGYLHEIQHEESLSAQEYFYVSRVVSHAFPRIFESQVVSAYNSPWLRDEKLDHVISGNLSRSQSVCCAGGIQHCLLYIGSSHSLLVQHIFIYTLLSSIPAGVVILVYHLSTDTAVIVAAVSIQLFVMIILIVVSAPKMTHHIAPSELLGDYANVDAEYIASYQTGTKEDSIGSIVGADNSLTADAANDDYYCNVIGAPIDRNNDVVAIDDDDNIEDLQYEPDELISPGITITPPAPEEVIDKPNVQENIPGDDEVAVDDYRDVEGAIVRVTNDVNMKARRLSEKGKAYRLSFTSPVKINIAQSMAAEGSMKPSANINPKHQVVEANTKLSADISTKAVVDRTTTQNKHVAGIGSYMSPVKRSATPSKAGVNDAVTVKSSNKSSVGRSASPVKAVGKSSYMSPLSRSESPSKLSANVTAARSSKTPDNTKKSKK